MTDLVKIKDVQEKLRRFRENPLSARPPTLNEITALGFPGELNNPIDQLSIFVYTLNGLIEKFEKLNRYEEIDFLLDDSIIIKNMKLEYSYFYLYKKDWTLLSK